MNELTGKYNSEEERRAAETFNAQQTGSSKPEDGEEYFEKYLEPAIDDVNPLIGLVERITRPIQEVQYNEQGSINIEKNNFHLSLSYSAIELDNIRTFQDNSSAFKIYPAMHKPDIHKEWRILNSLIIDCDDQHFDLQQFLPEGWRVLFKTSEVPTQDTAGETDFKNKTIILSTSIVEPFTLMCLFHELGHLEIDKKNGNEITFKPKGENYDRDIENALNGLLKRERDADAFALKKCKTTLIKGGIISRDDVIDFIHKIHLSSHSNFLRKFT